MQGTGWANYSCFLVWSVKRVSPRDVITMGLWGIEQPFFCVFVYFLHGDKQTNERTTNQQGDPRGSLLLTSEKAVFCKILVI